MITSDINSITISNILKNYPPLLRKEGFETPRLDVELILTKTLFLSREELLTHPEAKLTEEELATFKKLFEKRLNHKPIAYILGRKDFFGLEFEVNSATLIPRPETELLVEKALRLIENKPDQDWEILELGTGSGCISIAIAKNSNYFITATDISKRALATARKNSLKNKVKNQINFIQADLLDSFKNFNPLKKYLILANLPYLSKEIYTQSPKDVTCYEPASALLSGEDGLDHYRKLFLQIKNKLPCKKVFLLLEISPEQKESIKKEALNLFPKAQMDFYKDLAGKTRIVEIKTQG